MSGLELATQIRSEAGPADLPLVLLSSAGVQPGFGGPDAVGFVASLTKPVTAQQLGNCVARVLSAVPLAAAPVAPLAAADERSGLRLLLAEDNPANQRVAVLMLEKMGYVVEVAANGQIALDRLAGRKFDAVLMDCQMPVLDGYETTRRIRSGEVAGADARLPIIALTAYARPEDRARCLDAGMDDYVTKPIRATELRAALLRCGLGLVAPSGGGAGPAAPMETEGVFDEEALESARSLPGLGGPSLLPELIEVYLSDESERLERLGRLAAERQAVALGEEAHGFGGNAASFGGIQVRRVALDLERDARAGRWSGVDARLTQLRAACELLRSEVKRRNLHVR